MISKDNKDVEEDVVKEQQQPQQTPDTSVTELKEDLTDRDSTDTKLSKRDLKKIEKEKIKEDKEKEKKQKEEQKQKEKEDKEKREREEKERKLKEKEEKEKAKEEKKSKVLSPKLSKQIIQKTFSQENLSLDSPSSKPSSPLTIVSNLGDDNQLKPVTKSDSSSSLDIIKEEPIEDTKSSSSLSPSPSPITTKLSDDQLISSPPTSPSPTNKSSTPGSSSKDVVIKVTRAFAAVVHQNVLPEEGENKMRNKVINEIINTEKDYISDLNIIINVIYQPLKELKIITDKDLSTIFSNIQLLLNVNKEFLIDVEKAANENQGASIGPCFKFFAEYLKIYSSYCANQKTSSDHITHCSKKFPAFKQFLDEKHASPECRQCPLDSFLIKPIQRLCKYPLLLRELIKNSNEKHSDIVPLEEAYTKIQTVVLSVNESKRKAEVLQKMYKIHEKLETQEKFDFLTPTRYLIREDTLKELTEEKDKVSGKMHYYLFNDIIMRTKKDKKSIKLETLFLIASTKVNSEENRQSTFCNTFELQQLGSAGRKFTLVCDSYEQKMEWINDIEELIRPYEEESMREYEKLLDETFLYKRSTIATTSPTTTPESPKSLARSATASTLQSKTSSSQLSKPLPPPPPVPNKPLPPQPSSTQTETTVQQNIPTSPNPVSTFKKKPPPPPTTSTSTTSTTSTVDLSTVANITPPVIPVIAKPKPVGTRRIISAQIPHSNQDDNPSSISSPVPSSTSVNQNNNSNFKNRISLQVPNSPSSSTTTTTTSSTPTSGDSLNKYQFQPITKSDSNPSLVNPTTTTPHPTKSGRPLPIPKPSPTTDESPTSTNLVSSPPTTNVINSKNNSNQVPSTMPKFPSMANMKSYALNNNDNRKSVSTFTPSKARDLVEENNSKPISKDDLSIKPSSTNSPPIPPKINRIMPLPPTSSGTVSPSTQTDSNTNNRDSRQMPKPLPTIPPVVPPSVPKRNSVIPNQR
ncbi:pleckstrin (PH) domain-containing protein [Tieghemostelium lacteum]|uniref:Pleckstrin (PH) domain-containing protein n=1 Tax=Tieghemostelium lacteum TaxID=361077 RepID=A0A151Z5E8_TIELA|nr:pleckstrin (PH) domain-containing protein [Tieghemostelium lacteum]|eukprot:KYQ89024.1 pleckstrin (PH) domain-containing protein [Tieghemostelium lacteum]